MVDVVGVILLVEVGLYNGGGSGRGYNDDYNGSCGRYSVDSGGYIGGYVNDIDDCGSGGYITNVEVVVFVEVIVVVVLVNVIMVVVVAIIVLFVVIINNNYD